MSDLLTQLRKRWTELESSDQSAIKLGTIAVSLLLFIGLIVVPAYRSYDRLRSQAPNLQAKLEIMQAQAHETTRLRSNPSAQKSNESLLTVLEKSTTLHDIKSTVQSLTPRSDNTAAIRLKSIEYAKLIKWLAGLNSQYQLKASEAELTHSDKNNPGTVDAFVVFKE